MVVDFMVFGFNLLVFGVLLMKLVIFFGQAAFFRKVPGLRVKNLPTVSILIPARNEADNLPACIESLLNLDYPLDKLEIWIGNDQSSDTTGAIAKSYQQNHEHIETLDIQSDYHGLTARSNVLAQLAQKSGNDLMVFLDADMTVDAQWLKEMVAPTIEDYHLVSGYTQVDTTNILSHFQKFDWISILMLLKAAADINSPGTALGNNMLVSRKAYEAVGGYEQIGPTYTEDNDLSLAARKKGYRLFQIVSPGGARTQPMATWAELYKQRNRWMQGAFKQPFFRLLPLLLSRVFVLLALMAAIMNPGTGLMFILFVSFFDVVLSLMFSQKIKDYVPLHIAIFAPVFNSVLDTFTLLSYPWNKQVVWKGRKL